MNKKVQRGRWEKRVNERVAKWKSEIWEKLSKLLTDYYIAGKGKKSSLKVKRTESFMKRKWNFPRLGSPARRNEHKTINYWHTIVCRDAKIVLPQPNHWGNHMLEQCELIKRNSTFVGRPSYRVSIPSTEKSSQVSNFKLSMLCWSELNYFSQFTAWCYFHYSEFYNSQSSVWCRKRSYGLKVNYERISVQNGK